VMMPIFSDAVLRYTYPYGVAVGFIPSMLCERLPNTRKAQ